jgi:hypothetical protein
VPDARHALFENQPYSLKKQLVTKTSEHKTVVSLALFN